MRRAAVALSFLALAVAGLASAASPLKGFSQGVAAGEMTSTSARVWTRAPKPGAVKLIVVPARAKGAEDVRARRAPGHRFHRSARRRRPQARDDLPLHVLPEGRRLERAGSVHDRPCAHGSTSASALPSPATPMQPPGPNGKPAFNGFQTYARMAAENNDFNVNMGDTIYSDSEVAGSPPALGGSRRSGRSTSSGWRSRRPAPSGLGRALQPLGRPRVHQRLLAGRVRRQRLRVRSLKAFRRLQPRDASRPQHRDLPHVPLGEAISSSSSSTSARSAAARSPRSADGDLAPTAPTAVRAAFAALAPSLAAPVAAGVPRGDQRPVADDARGGSARRVHSARSAPRPRRGRS